MRLLLAALAALLVACPATEEHSEAPEIESWTVDPLTVMPGDEVTSTFTFQHFELTGEESEDGHEHEDGDSDDNHGHVHIYWDDLETNPLLMQVISEDVLTIPSDADDGPHTLIARLHNAEHLIIEPQVIEEIEITVDALAIGR